MVHKVAFLYTTGDDTDKNKSRFSLDMVEAAAAEFGIDMVYVAFQKRNEINWKQFKLVVLCPLFVYMPLHQETVKFLLNMKAIGVKFANPCSSMLWNMDKKYLLELQRSGISIPKTCLLEHGTNKEDRIQKLRDFMRKNNMSSAVLKPTVGAGGIGVRIVNDVHDDLMFEDEDVLAQEFVPEIKSAGEQSYVFFEERFSHAVRKTNSGDDFRVQRVHGGSNAADVATAAKIEYCSNVLKRIPREMPLAYSRVDFLEREATGELLLMEVELLEPQLFFSHVDLEAGSVGKYLRALAGVIESDDSA